jgi:hypothetical protein
MHSIHIAEWILRLVVSEDRAESTAGDLVETSAGQSSVWFWWSILRTTGAFVLRGLTEDPIGVAGAGFWGVVVDVVAQALVAVCTGVMLFVAALSTGHEARMGATGWAILLEVPLWSSHFGLGECWRAGLRDAN